MSLMSITQGIIIISLQREHSIFLFKDFEIEKYLYTLLRLILPWKKGTSVLKFFFFWPLLGQHYYTSLALLCFPLFFFSSFLIIENVS